MIESSYFKIDGYVGHMHMYAKYQHSLITCLGIIALKQIDYKYTLTNTQVKFLYAECKDELTSFSHPITVLFYYNVFMGRS